MISCDLFCTVVDNLGDAGVCWRLARQLALEHGWRVRLWIDDPSPLVKLRPGIDPKPDRQAADGVEVCQWQTPFPAVDPARVVIEAFACTLPETYVVAMAACSPAPVWINLEYLSAEDWVEGCHGQASPHPRYGLPKHFFFPGFTGATGGLLLEKDADFPGSPPQEPLTLSLFCYDNPALPPLLEAWRDGGEPVRCRVCAGLPRQQVETWLGEALVDGHSRCRGALTLEGIPFLPQTAYDGFLAENHLNFVRGEDSFVRTQWAQRPFVWQAYPQTDGAHQVKLDAFLDRYRQGLDGTSASALVDFWHAWNGHGNAAAAWPALRATLPALAARAQPWAKTLTRPGNLADNLVSFCQARIK